MALKYVDRVKETTEVIGTSSAVLLGASAGYRSFDSQLSNGDTLYYSILDTTTSQWEIGLGTYVSSNILARTEVLSSSNSNNAVSFGSGIKDVILIFSAGAINAIQAAIDEKITANNPIFTGTQKLNNLITMPYQANTIANAMEVNSTQTTNTPVSYNTGGMVIRSMISLDTDNLGTSYGMFVDSQNDPTKTGYLTQFGAFKHTLRHHGSSAVIAMMGNFNVMTMHGSGAITDAHSYYGTITNAGSSVITNAYGLKVAHSNTGIGSITNSYGVFVDTPNTRTGVTNRWGIYVEDDEAPSYFAAPVTLNAGGKLNGISVYADNTSALAGGLVAGDIYRTSTGVLMVVY